MSAMTIDDLEDAIASLHPKAKELVRVAVKVGWTVHTISRGDGVNLAPPGPGSTLQVPPVRQWNDRKLRTLGMKILRYGDPELVAKLEAEKKAPTAPMAVPRPPAIRVVPEPVPEPAEPPPPAKKTPLAQQYVKPAEPAPTPSRLAPVDDGPPIADPELRPWLAKAVEGVLYPSVGVLERDVAGHVVYVCAIEDCQYESDNPYAVRSHWNRTIDHTVDSPRKIEYKRAAVLTETASAPARELLSPADDPLSLLDRLRQAILTEREAGESERLKQVVAELAAERDELVELLAIAEQEINDWQHRWDQAAAIFGRP